MSSILERGGEGARYERAISSLSDATGASLARVRLLFVQELARLTVGAKVGSYLSVLATSKVRALLRRTGELSRAEKNQLAAQVTSWEDEGGTTAPRCSPAAD